MAEEIVSQIIAEIVAEDQMTQTLRDAKRKVRKFGKDIDKLNDVLSEQEKAALAAAKADKKLAASMSAAGKESKRLKERTDKLKKGLEGIAQGMGISAISGERLSSSYLAIGAAAGAIVGGGLALLKGALETYTERNKEAQEASARLTKQWEDMQVAAVEASLGADGLANAFDRNTARLAILTEAMFPAIEGFDKMSAAEKKAALEADRGIIKLAKWHPLLNELINNVNLATNAFDDLFDVQKKVAEQTFNAKAEAAFKRWKEAQNQQHKDRLKAIEDEKKFFDEVDKRANKAAAAERKRAAAAAAAARKLLAANEKMAKRTVSEALGLNEAIANATIMAAKMQEIVDKSSIIGRLGPLGIEENVFDTSSGFGDVQTGDAGAVLSGLESELGTSFADAQSPTSMMTEDTINLDAALNDLAAGGIASVTAGIGGYIEALAAGEEMQVSFGTGLLIGMGEMMQQVGAGMIALSTAKLIADGGFISPIAGLAVGGLLVASGAAMAGFGKRGLNKGGGKSDAKETAAEVADVITARIGIANDRDDRQGGNFQVIIGERPIRDITIQAFNQAISNREINTLSLAGASL